LFNGGDDNVSIILLQVVEEDTPLDKRGS